MLTPDRLRLARQRRKLTGKRLAELAGLTAVTISKIENGHQPDDKVVAKLAMALGYPLPFFFRSEPETLIADTVSFRSLKKMTGLERDAALAAGSLGIEVYDWIESHFNLPKPDLVDLSKERDRPDIAARLLRQHWQLGDRPIGNVMRLLESKGVRVLSLSENTQNVDAYSFWMGDYPYVFLNRSKTAERSIFDMAHELGHLVLHNHSGARSERGSEMQADRFASAFLMPESDVRNQAVHAVVPSDILRAKARWKVSALALCYRLHSLGLISEWGYRSLCIDLGRLGYRSGEPVTVGRETSAVIEKVLTALWGRQITKADIANDLAVPLSEIENLLFGLANKGDLPMRPTSRKLELAS